MSADIETHEPYKATVKEVIRLLFPAAGELWEAVVATVLAQEILKNSHQTI